jgi:hypothetical protein
MHLNGTTIEVFADGEIEAHDFEFGRLVRLGADGSPQIARNGEPVFGVVSRGGRWPQVIIVGCEPSARCKVGVGGSVGAGDRVTSDADGFVRISAGADCFGIAVEHCEPGNYVVVRFLATVPDEIADDE